MTAGWSLVAANDAVTAAIGDRDMLVWGDDRRTYAEVADRTRGLAGFLVDHGITVERERSELERWECGQATVALVMHNRPEYFETMFGAYRARAVPFNVNHHYRPHEIASLFEMLDAKAVVYAREQAPLLAEALAGRDDLVLLDIEDGTGHAPLPGSVPFEAAIAAGRTDALPVPSPDDLYLVCTGGTTGSPKAVLWRQADIFVAGMAGSDDFTPETLGAWARDIGGRWFAAPPLMHAAAQWTAFCGLHVGATIVVHDDRGRFDARALLEVCERERINIVSIVGDAYARPMVEELQRRAYDLSSLERIGTGGAVTSEHLKVALLDLLPHVTVMDGYGASETGGMAFGARRKDGPVEGLAPGPGAVVLSADRSRLLEPGEDEEGWTARRGRVPLGYLNDRAATEATFPIVDGERFAVPGDRATLDGAGGIHILGRDSMVVNTGGEKVFVEEVEEQLRTHPAVFDALVVGRPSDRFGQEVVGVVQLRPGTTATPAELRDHCAERLARFKAPRAIAFCDEIGRHPSGKPDYQWVKAAATHAVDATAEG
ncbi:MAG: AMP-binding protein [Actinomycetota bacterium]|nr:AMP-binding protein [Actinomycetota bacterium]